MGSESIWVVTPQYTDPAGFGDNYMLIETTIGEEFPDYWAALTINISSTSDDDFLSL